MSVEKQIEFFKQYNSKIITEKDERTIRIHDVYGGPLEFFFLLEWEDTGMFFCQDSYLVISNVDGAV